MPKLYYLDADLNGLDSIQDVIEANPQDIIVTVVDTFERFDKRVIELQDAVQPGDVVVLDTITSLANTTRGDSKLGTDTKESLWAKRSIYQSDKNYLNVYEMTAQLIMRRLANLRALGARIIVLAHEKEKTDETDFMKKRGPDVNDGLLGMLMSKSSDVLRLSVQSEEILKEDGSVAVPADTRVLQMKKDDSAIAKVHVSLERSPLIKKLMYNPTMAKIEERLGKKPSFLTIYGAPGVGKTSLAVSIFRKAKEKATK